MNQERKNEKKTSSLLIITDDNDNFDYSIHLLNIFNKKFNDLNIKLNRIYLINKSEFNDIKRHLKSLQDSSNDFDILTTSKSSNTSLLFNLIDEVNVINNFKQIDLKNVLIDFNDLKIQNGFNTDNTIEPSFLTVSDNRVFVLNQDSFHYQLALCMKILLKRSNMIFSFKTEQEVDQFLKNLNSLFSLELTKSNLINDFSDESLSITNFYSNYWYLSVQVKYLNEKAINLLKKDLSFNCTVPYLNDNYINADFYIYEFDLCRSYIAQMSNEMNTFDPGFNEDIEFLLSKIDLNLFLSKLKQSIDIIEEAIKKNTDEQICVSFNGGKDCCVVLYLYYAIASRLGIKFPIHLVLIKIQHEFDEMIFFINHVIRKFYKNSIDFIIFEDTDKSMKDCLWVLKETHPKISNILIGTRRSDGDYFKNMKAFETTDGDWPKFMRVSPILDWTFSEVWYFIRLLRLPYCSLYDQGYTSIDHSQNTVKNKELLCPDQVNYLPAFRLQNSNAERLSRKKK